MFMDDGYIIGREPTTYDEACEARRELEPKAIVAEREAIRRRFVRAVEAAEQRIARRRELEAQRGQACDVEGCSGDLTSPESCCDACLLQFLLEAQRAAAAPMVNGWTTADGRYFSSDVDAQQQQRWLAATRQRHADRIAAYARRRGAWTDQAERDFLTQRFGLTDEGRAALAEAEAQHTGPSRGQLAGRRSLAFAKQG